MKHIYGFISEDPEVWGDIFEDEDKSPEVLISSACHLYYDEKGRSIVGFDVSLGLPKKTMDSLLKNYCKNPKVIKAL